MLCFKAITCPFEHEEKQFVFINSKFHSHEMHTCEHSVQFGMPLNRTPKNPSVASHLLFVLSHNRFCELFIMSCSFSLRSVASLPSCTTCNCKPEFKKSSPSCRASLRSEFIEELVARSMEFNPFSVRPQTFLRRLRLEVSMLKYFYELNSCGILWEKNFFRLVSQFFFRRKKSHSKYHNKLFNFPVSTMG